MKPNNRKLIALSAGAILLSAAIFTGCRKESSEELVSTATEVSSDSPSVSARASNKSPVIKTGPDQTYTTAVSSITLDGSGSSDPDGSIVSYAWTKDIGNGGTITSPSSAKTTVTGLTAGVYRFKLTIKDNKGAVVSDTIRITNGSGGTTTPPPTGTNPAPVVNAGSNQTITLPLSSVTLSGSATDANGTIASYLWTKVSGTGGAITNPNTASTTVTGLTAGTYVFNLKATDNGGASGNKTVTVTVNAATTTPPPTGGGTTGTLTYSNNFDNTSSINSNQLGSGGISTSVYKTGPGSFRSEVKAGAGQISGGYRSEQQYGDNLSPNNTAITVEYDIMFETLPNVAGLAVQWHGNTSGTSGQLSMWTQGGKFMVMRNVIGTAGSSNIYQSGNLMSIVKGKWYHFKWEIKFTSGSDGYVRCYIDNSLYYSATGKTSDGSGQYLKVGQNLFASPGNNSVLYIDNLKTYKN
ncbi:MAG: heparin lyase I family protein [Bacteroidota bacterium]